MDDTRIRLAYSACRKGEGVGDSRMEQALKRDFSQGTEQFREDLLGRCLDVLGADNRSELADAELDMLAAAGEQTMAERKPFRDNIL
jgi:hypothetical protein